MELDRLAGLLALLVTLRLALSNRNVLLSTRRLTLLLALRHTLHGSSSGHGLVSRSTRGLARLLALRLTAR